MGTSEITSAFEQARGKWTGCHWSTQFGSRGLNLQGLKSSQAALMARSTAGRESADWKAAMRWLEQVERDAREAERQAGIAADLASQGRIDQALEHAQRACDLELNYNESHLWQPLQKAVAAALHQSALDGSPFVQGDSTMASISWRTHQP